MLKILTDAGGRSSNQEMYAKVKDFYPQMAKEEFEEKQSNPPFEKKGINAARWAQFDFGIF